MRQKTYLKAKKCFKIHGCASLLDRIIHAKVKARVFPYKFCCGITCVNLNSRTDCIMLTILECMRLTCCVLHVPREKALNICV